MTNELKQTSIGEERRFLSTLHNDNSRNINNTTASNKQQEYMGHSKHSQQHHRPPDSKQRDVKIEYNPIVPEAGRQTKLIISVKEKSGTTVREYELVHDKLMHLIIVGEDLSYFAHIHPILNNGENFTIVHTFPEAARYKLWLDFKPKGGIQNVLAFMVDVRGFPIHNPVIPVHDGIYIKESSEKNYQISLKLPQERIVANKDVDIVFSLYDAAGNPVIDLEPLMGAGGHSVIISSDIQDFLHVHPTENVNPDWKGGPHISFRTTFPKPGLYKTWGQFQHKGRLVIADFTLEVG
jgi:hypothetical protein